MIRVQVGDRIALVDDGDYDLVSRYTWHVNTGNNKNFYAQAYSHMVGGRSVYVLMHNLIMGCLGVDHVDGDGFNNQQSNLRLATKAQNNANKRTGTSSKYKGVCKHSTSGKWKAHITKDYKNKHLGLFEKEEDAARAYDKAARELFGEFALCNFPDKDEV